MILEIKLQRIPLVAFIHLQNGIISCSCWWQLFSESPLPRFKLFVKLKYIHSGKSPRAHLIEARSIGAKEEVKVLRAKWGGGRVGNESLLSFSC